MNYCGLFLIGGIALGIAGFEICWRISWHKNWR
jgi:hypothetical protein